MPPASMTEITVTIQVSDGYRKALAAIHDYEADSRKRATVEAMQAGFSDILAVFLDDAIQEHAQQKRSTLPPQEPR